jgi:hypothetical protein
LPQPRQAELVDVEATQEGSRWIHGRPNWRGLRQVVRRQREAPRRPGGQEVRERADAHHRQGEDQGRPSRVDRQHRHRRGGAPRPHALRQGRDSRRVLLGLHGAARGVGRVIEPAPIIGGGVEGLPPGFFRMAIQKSDGKVVNFVCCSMRVRILKAGTVKTTISHEGRPRSSAREPVVVTEGVPVAVSTPPAVEDDRHGRQERLRGPVRHHEGRDGRGWPRARHGGHARDPRLGRGDRRGHARGAGLRAVRSASTPQNWSRPGSDAPSEAPATNLRAEIEAMIAQLEEEKPEALEEIRAWAKERS